jgi:VIT1/CCC1 family predicted Fe2+/Mn2+ transporter
MSPTAQFFGFIFAGFWVIFPLLFGEKKYQIFAGCILALCFLLSFNTYPAFYKDYHGYIERKSKQK